MGVIVDPEIDDLVRRLVRLEDEIERKLAAQRKQFRYAIEKRRAVFEAEARRRHRALRTGLVTFLRRSPLGSFIVAPVIYGVIVPIALLDLGVFLFMLVCFPVWGVGRVRRRDYIVIDRHRLGYLNAIEKLNCVYCGYANGVIAYAREAASRTEQYWCPIKHALRVPTPHRRYHRFVDYGDAEDFSAKMKALRDQVRAEQADKPT